jgi:hypothetical protein
MNMESNQIGNKFIIGATLLLCVTMVVFETAQQLYYVRLYNIYNATVTFNELFVIQFRKWVIWVLFATLLWFFIKNLAEKTQLTSIDIFKTIAFIFALLALVIFSMSIVEMLLNDQAISANRLWNDYFTFYTFQKTPIYSFGYTFLALIFYLYCKNNQLIIQVLKLSELNQKDLQQYYQQKAKQDVETSVLKIKVGTSYKIIAIDDIDWIEADDYCVNIHSSNIDAVYSMRTTLKALEKILPDHFLRVHRSAIVNMQGVQEYQTQGTGLIKMKNGDEIAVAKSKIKLIKEFF